MAGNGIAVGAVASLIVISALLMVGVNVNEGVADSTALTENDTFYTTQQSVVTGTQNSYAMTGTLQTIIIAGAVIMLLLGMVYFVR